MDRIEMRPAKTKRERLVAALNSTDADIFLYGARFYVTGKNIAGERIVLGEFDDMDFPDGLFARFVDRCRFGVF
jgi:hypothetical protein